MRTLTRSLRRHVAVGWVALLALGTILSPGPALAATAAVSPSVVQPGTSLTVVASGFDANEDVVSWASSVHGSVATASGTADDNGNVSLTIDVKPYWEAGNWALTVHGRTSKAEGTAAFQVQRGSSGNGLEVSPVVATPGTSVKFHAAGFDNHERVSMWVTQPDGSAVAVAGSPIKADGGEISFTYTLPPDAQTGIWSITVYGNSSVLQFVSSFTVSS